ncbi:hypothetical protein DJ031_04170 [bacterium endosymbiont of Escarpia laminata]|nr:MAG: hypothetical protein DJ031_04170 [bacterium endosymbiont of Escarpia laminata]
MDRLIFNAALILGAYLPFESMVMRYLPGADSLQSILFVAVEASIYLLFVLLLTTRLGDGRPFRRTLVDLPLLLFVTIAFVSLVKNGSDPMPAVTNLRTLLRYVVLFYILANLRVRPEQIRIVFRLIIILGLIQATIAIVQFLGGEGIKQYFYLRQMDTEIAGKTLLTRDPTTDRIGAGIGTLGQPGILAMFLLISLSVAASDFFMERSRPLRETLFLVVAIALLLLGILTTYKRAAIVLGAFIPILALLLSGDRRRIVPGMLLLMIGGALMIAVDSAMEGGNIVSGREAREHQVAVFELMRHLVSEEYWDKSATASRLWFFREAAVSVFGSFNLLGFGPDPGHAIQLFVADRSGLSQLLTYNSYRDVYWMALLVYFGILGFSIWMFLLWRLGRNANRIRKSQLSITPTVRKLAVTVLILIVVTFIYTFIERTLIIRAYAFYFWFLVGLLSASGYGWNKDSAKSPIETS